jgi:hypothetical protein
MKRFRRALIVVCLAIVMFFLPLLACPHRIDETHHELIRTGMSEAEVEAIFGVPAGNYDWAVKESRYRVVHAAVFQLESQQLIWDASEAAAPSYVKSALGLSQSTPQFVWFEISGDMRIWTSRNGSFTLWFDRHGKVTSTGHRDDVRIEPPWLRWWNEHVAK